MNRYGVFNRGLRRLPGLACFMGGEIVAARFGTPSELTATLGWGRRRHARRARRVAQDLGIPFLCLEDGFLRSLGLGHVDPPLSVVVDDLGIYYDASAPSRLEQLIATPHSNTQRERAGRLVASWQRGRLSKYNHARDVEPPLASYVLVVDQTAGDASIGYGLADGERFALMLEAALDEHPDTPVLLKVHPDVVAGRRRGHFDNLSAGAAARVTVIAGESHPAQLLQRAEAVYAVTSQMGFEALLWNKTVRVFGMPFYAGWGLTADHLRRPERRSGCVVAMTDLVHAALIEYPRYRDPETGSRCEAERVADWLALQRRMRSRFPEQVRAVGFSRWKKPTVRAFFGGSTVHFASSAKACDGALAVWGRCDAGTAADVVRLEDGFLRSVGLGADLVRPVSWVMDRRGIYYDPRAESDLEHLLQHVTFDDALISRARSLRQRIVATGVTKYNVGRSGWQRPPGATHVVLVPGQVESDASIACGTRNISTNHDLLMTVRQTNPGAYVVYKPHPDVVARLRAPGAREADARLWCDEVILDGAMSDLLAQVDTVATMTSLTGFEGLMRGRRVVCYGQPFYSGWGLTEDAGSSSRRTRRLTLDELVAGVLILYPTYVSRVTGRFTTPERALDELIAWRASPARTPWWRGMVRQLLAVGARTRAGTRGASSASPEREAIASKVELRGQSPSPGTVSVSGDCLRGIASDGLATGDLWPRL